MIKKLGTDQQRPPNIFVLQALLNSCMGVGRSPLCKIGLAIAGENMVKYHKPPDIIQKIAVLRWTFKVPLKFFEILDQN